MAIEGTIDSPAVETTPEPTQTPTDPAKSTSIQEPAAPAKNTAADDAKTKGLLADLQKERKARQERDAWITERDARLTERDRQIAALTGSKIPTADEAEAAAVQAQFKRFFPHLADLSPDDVKALREMQSRRGQIDEVLTQTGMKHARQMVGAVTKEIETELGTLNERQKRKIAALYISEAEADPEFLKRHDAGDETLVKEFVKNYLDDFVEPVRRKVTAAEVTRNRAVPGGRDRTLPSQNGKPIDVNDPKAVEDALVKGFQDKGGTFGRR